jgi:zinc/manganese transport system permease protein
LSIDGLDPGILGPAFLAGLLVLSTHVPLGRQVLSRGIIFIDLAVAQFAGLGVILARTLGIAEAGWAVQAVAFAAALTGVAALYACERRCPRSLEAVIGSAFVVAASAGILLLAGSPHAGRHLQELLVGQILWVGYDELAVVALLYAAVLGLWLALDGARRPLLFYLLFAVAVTASVQLVGIYLVFASLILPALAVRSRARGGVWIAWVLGGAGYGIGLVLSALLDLPAGAMIVCTLAAFAVLVAAVPQARTAAG